MERCNLVHTNNSTERKIFRKTSLKKPLPLLKRIVLSSKNNDDLILDPFTGSFTTGIAAYKHDRRFIGIDSKEEYLKLSIKRFKEQKEKDGQQTLNGF